MNIVACNEIEVVGHHLTFYLALLKAQSWTGEQEYRWYICLIHRKVLSFFCGFLVQAWSQSLGRFFGSAVHSLADVRERSVVFLWGTGWPWQGVSQIHFFFISELFFKRDHEFFQVVQADWIQKCEVQNPSHNVPHYPYLSVLIELKQPQCIIFSDCNSKWNFLRAEVVSSITNIFS